MNTNVNAHDFADLLQLFKGAPLPKTNRECEEEYAQMCRRERERLAALKEKPCANQPSSEK